MIIALVIDMMILITLKESLKIIREWARLISLEIKQILKTEKLLKMFDRDIKVKLFINFNLINYINLHKLTKQFGN